jgi:hypothetical protein
VNDDGSLGNAGLEQLGEMLLRHRPAEQVALRLVIFMGAQEFQLSCVSTPSARTRSFRLRLMPITAVTKVVSTGAELIWRTNDWPI